MYLSVLQPTALALYLPIQSFERMLTAHLKSDARKNPPMSY